MQRIDRRRLESIAIRSSPPHSRRSDSLMRVTRPSKLLPLAACLLAALGVARANAEEHITLTNGIELNCVRRELLSGTNVVRLHTGVTTYLDVAASSIRLIEPLVESHDAATMAHTASPLPVASAPQQPGVDIPSLLADAGSRHHIDADLLHALVHAESAFHSDAVSRTGARGLMQLMPATAASLGVQDAFRPEQNIAGGTAYLDQLLTRFHDDIALALAAYNAGPAAVDRYHGIPPYRETRAYVARILTEYNKRKQSALASIPRR